MASTPPPKVTRKGGGVPAAVLLAGLLAVAVCVAVVLYLNGPAPRPSGGEASAEAKAYLPHLELKDVTMQASENFMQQRVVEIEGAISDNGQRALRSITIYCLFYGTDGHEVHRETAAVISASASPLKPGETRHFRLPFDDLPSSWNQALPRMVIAQLTFAP